MEVCAHVHRILGLRRALSRATRRHRSLGGWAANATHAARGTDRTMHDGGPLVNTIVNYVPADRRHALAKRTTLAARTAGAALFADIAGFTPATEAIAQAFGTAPRRRGAAGHPQPDLRGADRRDRPLWRQRDRLCWRFPHRMVRRRYAGPQSVAGRRAVACALAMRAAMASFQAIAMPGDRTLTLALKITVAAGPVRRLLVGDPAAQLIEVLAGATVARLAAACRVDQAGRGGARPGREQRCWASRSSSLAGAP